MLPKAEMDAADFTPSAKVKGYSVRFRIESKLKADLERDMSYRCLANENYDPSKKKKS